jgi:hypothetical protein
MTVADVETAGARLSPGTRAVKRLRKKKNAGPLPASLTLRRGV